LLCYIVIDRCLLFAKRLGNGNFPLLIVVFILQQDDNDDPSGLRQTVALFPISFFFYDKMGKLYEFDNDQLMMRPVVSNKLIFVFEAQQEN